MERVSINPYPANCLTIALGGSIGCTFLQKQPFYTSQNVAVLQPLEELSDEILLVLATLIQKESDKRFVAFGRELNKHIKVDFTIKLPFNMNDTPDWVGLTEIVNSEISPKLPPKTKQVLDGNFNLTPINRSSKALHDVRWGRFYQGLIPHICKG